MKITQRLRYAMDVLNKTSEVDQPVCKSKDAADEVAELMRLAEDACDSIERLQAEVRLHRENNKSPETQRRLLDAMFDVDVNGDVL